MFLYRGGPSQVKQSIQRAMTFADTMYVREAWALAQRP
uniref:Uncharacterized protein n=1 Tax=Rhizobium leguminosarum bv. viciae TaxID=387 RepID=A0A0U3J9E0_RHILV|nr:hypothetical protein [Rhizobium leguminosarum bv. viciae]